MDTWILILIIVIIIIIIIYYNQNTENFISASNWDQSNNLLTTIITDNKTYKIFKSKAIIINQIQQNANLSDSIYESINTNIQNLKSNTNTNTISNTIIKTATNTYYDDNQNHQVIQNILDALPK